MQVLTIDYTQPSAPELFSRSLRETGFAVLTQHPISMDIINQAYHQWRDFFYSELSNKEQYLYSKLPNRQDGYFPYLTENAKDTNISDLKEFFHFYPWGRTPEELKMISLQVYKTLHGLTMELLEWVERYLPDYIAGDLTMPLTSMIEDSPNTLLRILHYPPLKGSEDSAAVRASAHEDINFITLLPAATTPGLEVKDVNGQWHAVQCDPGSIVINVADMLQTCTQGYYKSTTHRVVNPSSGAENSSRFSMPFFLHGRDEVILSKKEPNKRYKDYLDDRLRAIGIY